MNNIYYELAQTQLALDAAQKVIRRQRGKLFGKNLLLVGTIGLFWTACKMLDPYSPYDQFEDWYRFDTDKGYNSSGLLMRMAYTSDQLTDAENAYEIEQAIDQIVANDPLNIYKKLKLDIQDDAPGEQTA